MTYEPVVSSHNFLEPLKERKKKSSLPKQVVAKSDQEKPEQGTLF